MTAAQEEHERRLLPVDLIRVTPTAAARRTRGALATLARSQRSVATALPTAQTVITPKIFFIHETKVEIYECLIGYQSGVLF